MGFSFLRMAVLAVLLVTTPLTTPVLGQDDWGDDDWGEESHAIPIHGYVEAAGGARLQDDATQSRGATLGEARFRFDLAHYSDKAEVSVKADLLNDALLGATDVDLRMAWLLFRAGDWLDVRAGRQVLTWGTGDLVFLNDLFPKDFVSFFAGRDDEFLKAPSNAIKFSAFTRALNFDVVWTPLFSPDRYLTGERFSFYDPSNDKLVSAETMGRPLAASLPDQTLENSELAARLFRNANAMELAIYGYWGFFKQPTATIDSSLTFARMAAAGASVRGNLLGGVANAEGSMYVSRGDREGNDPRLPNSQARVLVGFERELFRNVTGGFQGYVEKWLNHDEMVAQLAAGEVKPDETRTLLTARLTWRLQQDTLTLALFGFFAPEQGDSHWRPAVTRKISDTITIAAGANVMAGDANTFFGQLEDNSNAYVRIRYSF